MVQYDGGDGVSTCLLTMISLHGLTMKSALLTACTLLVVSSTMALSQSMVTNGLVLTNSNSTIKLVNPNSDGSFTLTLPVMPALAVGEQQELVLKVVGTESGPQMQFVPSTQATYDPLLSPSSTKIDLSRTTPAQKQAVVHTFAELDLPSVAPGSAFVLKINEPSIKAGAAISISPAGEMPTGLFPAFAWAPIDCVVMIKFMNMGPTAVDLPAMQFSVGAINP